MTAEDLRHDMDLVSRALKDAQPHLALFHSLRERMTPEAYQELLWRVASMGMVMVLSALSRSRGMEPPQISMQPVCYHQQGGGTSPFGPERRN